MFSLKFKYTYSLYDINFKEKNMNKAKNKTKLKALIRKFPLQSKSKFSNFKIYF